MINSRQLMYSKCPELKYEIKIVPTYHAEKVYLEQNNILKQTI